MKLAKTVLFLAILGFAPLLTLQPAAALAGDCRHVDVPVALGPGKPASQTINGMLCLPASQQFKQTIDFDILVAGATYNHLYWDWPQQPGLYSYVAKTLRSGRATFNYDRIGTGKSSHPPSAQVTLDADAYILHQLVDWLRKSNAQPIRVTTIGHSLGSGVVMAEAATYQDVDRVVLTGALHAVGSGLSSALTSFHPAPLDPLFFGKIFDPGYLTTTPNTRGPSFYAASAEANVIAYDEAHKNIVSGVEFGAYPVFLLPPALNISSLITTPVLTIAGQQDALTCGGMLDCTDTQAVYANEAPYFASAANLTVHTVANTGHNLTLHPSANTSFDLINSWVQSH